MPQRSVPGIDQRTSVPGVAETVGPETIVARRRGAAAAGHGSEQTSANAAVRTYAASPVLTDPRFSNPRGVNRQPSQDQTGLDQSKGYRTIACRTQVADRGWKFWIAQWCAHSSLLRPMCFSARATDSRMGPLFRKLAETSGRLSTAARFAEDAPVK